MTPATFASELRAEGLVVVEVGDWETHNRNHVGPWGPVHGVMIHHTVTKGSAATVDICRKGYTGLPGPLCHGVITKDGRVHLVGYGRTNHAGSGDGDVLAAVIAEKALPADNEADTDGNRYFYGFECENLGDGEDPWPDAQLEAIEKVSAAICRHHGWGAGSVIGHLEWQPGKTDPRGISMQTMRGRIAARLDGNQPPQQEPQEEDGEMKLSDQIPLGDWIPKQWPNDKGLQDKKIPVDVALGSGYAHSRKAAENTVAILAQLGAQAATIDKLVDAIGTGGGLTAAEIKAAAEAGAQAALDKLGDALKEN
ncbi:N-acetylmuramoyl-L-alanine amidase [Streptomyces nigra]